MGTASGGLAVFVGDRVLQDNYNQEIPRRLLPAELGPIVPVTDPVLLRATATNHPAVRTLHKWRPEALSMIIVERYVRVVLVEKNVQQIIDYSDGAVAVAERIVGGGQSGHVLLCTTSISPARPDRIWNNLPHSRVQFVMLVHGVAAYLGRHTDQQLTYQAGEDVIIRPHRDERFGNYLLVTPDSEHPTRRSVDPAEAVVVVTAPEPLGNYRITATQNGRTVERGFSVNANTDESQLVPVSDTELTSVFGDGNFAVARSLEELREAMGEVRIGRELFPWLMVLIFLIFILEHFLANRFYKSETGRRRAVRSGRSLTEADDSVPSIPEKVGV